MSGFLDGLTGPIIDRDVDEWRAAIESKRTLAAGRRAREQAAAHSSAVRTSSPAQLQQAKIPRHLRKAGITPPRTQRPTKVRAQGQRVTERSRALGDRIVELYSRGDLGQKAIGAALGCSGSTVAFHLKSRGVPALRARGRRLTKPTGSKPKVYEPDLVEKVRALAAEKLTQLEIAERVGLGRKVIHNIMRRHGIAPGPAVARSPRDHVIDLKDLMRKSNVSSREVRAWAIEAGVPISDRGLPPRSVLEAFLATLTATEAA